MPQNKKELILHWAQRFAGDPVHYTKPYQNEIRFTEGKSAYWLVVNGSLIPQFEKDVKVNETVDLYVIRLGGIRSKEMTEWVLLVESFSKLPEVQGSDPL